MIDVLIMSPANYATGGVELLHQLCAEMSKHEGIRARMLYRNAVAYRSPQPKEYEQYGCEYITQLPQDYSGYIVFPEIWANDVTESQYDKCKPVIFWESVDNYFKFSEPRDFFKFLNRHDTIHLFQSAYAKQFLQKQGVTGWYVGDYINEDYFSNTENLPDSHGRNRTVLYNPAKGLEFTKQIIAYFDGNATFIPISGMSRNEVIDLMRHSMVYIDFGDHPGKERIPREAAMSGCCIITSKNGSALNKWDVAIPDKFKFTRQPQNLRDICDTIHGCLDYYDTYTHDFDAYRQKIRGERKIFREGVDDFVYGLFREEESE